MLFQYFHAFLLAAGFVVALPCHAQTNNTKNDGIPEISLARSIPLQGAPDDLRKAFYQHGITTGAIYIGEVWSNKNGGLKTGNVFDGRLEVYLDIDLDRVLAVNEFKFHTNAYYIHGNSISDKYIGNYFAVSNVEAASGIRLSEIWFEKTYNNTMMSFRLGQLAADSEFVTSTFAASFSSSTFGWPGANAANLPSGGVAYPFAAPGLRVKFTPSESWSFLAAVFDGDPAGPGPDKPQNRNTSGTSFRTSDPAFVIVEAQYQYNQGKENKDPAGTIKVGGWYYFGLFDDLRIDSQGGLLASPFSKSVPAIRQGNEGLYIIFDQQLYRPPNAEADKGIGIFTRLLASPQNRNLIDFYIDGGVIFAGLDAARANDSFGVAVAYGKISDKARAADRDFNQLYGQSRPIRDYEALLEVVYTAQILEGWSVQPDFQYIWHPGAKGSNPKNASAGALKDAAIVGLRTTLKY